MPLSSVPNLAPDFRGGYAGEATFSGGGGYDPTSAAATAANSIGGANAISAAGNIAPNFSTAGGYVPGQVESTGGGYDPSIAPSLAGSQITNPKFVNPLANLVAVNATTITKTFSEVQNNLPNIGNFTEKLNLDNKISQLAGGLTSGLNGLAAAGPNLLGGVANNLTGFANTAMTGIGNPVQNAIGGAVSSLQSVTGSISNITADISGSLNKLTGGNLAGGVQSVFGKVSAAAGVANNLLSVLRGRNLPAGGELFKTSGTPIKLEPNAKDDWRVRINCNWDTINSPIFQRLRNTGGVVWPYLPTVSVWTKANYSQIDTVHSNYPYQAYKNSIVDDISIAGDFTAETEEDAAYWIAATLFFKTATKMFFGQGDQAGNPPIICNLTGYGSSVFDKIPVIIKSFNVDLPDNVNYVKCNTFGTNTWVPVMSTISVTVTPIYNRTRLRQFSLQDYAKGKVAEGVGYI